MPLAIDRFDLASFGRADPDRYLILGFDTEYQRYVDQPERRLENDVDSERFLSFQWSTDPTDREYFLQVIENLMDRMELPFDSKVVSSYFSSRRGSRLPPRPHSELRFKEFSNEAFKDAIDAIDAIGLGEFWRP